MSSLPEPPRRAAPDTPSDAASRPATKPSSNLPNVPHASNPGIPAMTPPVTDETVHAAAESELDPKLAPQLAAVEAARNKLVADIDVLDDEVRLEVLYRMESFAWKAVAGVAAAVAGLATTKVLNVLWDKVIPDSDPPDDPTDPDIPTRDALVWTALTGLGVGLATVFAQRGAAKGWTRATGVKPLAFEKKKKKKGKR